MAPFEFIRAATNTTIIPPGYTNHGIKGLLCGPADWFSIITFYGINYIAHCLTVKYYPAETIGEKTMVALLALLLPSSGITRALDAIMRRSRFRGVGELEQAAFAGALIMVVRNKDWTPQVGDYIRDMFVEGAAEHGRVSEQEVDRHHLGEAIDVEASHPISSGDIENPRRGDDSEDLPLLPLRNASGTSLPATRWAYWTAGPSWMKQGIKVGNRPEGIVERGCKIHGLIGDLPTGYDLTYVPLDAQVRPLAGGDHGNSYRIASSYNIPKALLSIFQTCYAAITIYRARGDQITVFGYAAFGLTVLPYLIMSLVNLVAQVVTADYDTLYLVHSPELEEAQKRGCIFEGITGTLVMEDSSVNKSDQMWDEVWKVTEQTDNSIVVERQSKDQEIVKNKNLKLEKGHGEVVKENRVSVVFPHCARFKRKFGPTGKPSPYKLNQTASDMRARISTKINLLSPLIFISTILVAVGGLTKFRVGSSTHLERGFILSWMLVGGLMGSSWNMISSIFLLAVRVSDIMEGVFTLLFALLFFGAFFVPAIGGLVVVGKELVQFGICSRIA